MLDEFLDMRMRMKIAIIGNSGSGKSTLGVKLSKALNIPLYHLDQYYWQPGWQEPDYFEFTQIHNDLCDQENWIIEGMNCRILEYRFLSANIIIFLDIPAYKCLYRVIKRSLMNFGKVRTSSAKGCPEKIPDLKFLKFILTFSKMRKPKIDFLLQYYTDGKKIFVLKNKTQMKNFINDMKAYEK